MNHLLKQLFLLLVLAVLAAQPVQAADNAAPAKPKEVHLSGKVLETMDGGGYTYVQLQNGPEKVWVAIPLTKVKVGQQLSLVPGFEMKNFTSKGLNRKFDKVVFSAGVANEKIHLSESAVKMAHQGVPNAPTGSKAQQAPKQAKQTKPAAKKNVKVAKAKGANAYTVSEIYAKKGKLEKKQVVVRGRVTKVAERIMKKNWIHIQDGTGSKGKKTDELVVTSKQVPKEGDIVTATGTLYNNLDFGSGYRYTVLIQNANLK
uniref:Nucleic acid binding, OB-fold, tRNA/helicase-type n=1 Tax=Geobacter sp. (strain M21) TaxID=443144 RepID=C6E508_GEOSM